MITTNPRYVMAEYRDDELPIYQGNPLIEALPAVRTDEEALQALKALPPLRKADRQLPPHLRLHMVQEIMAVNIPMPNQLDLFQRFDRMIRMGYRGRNPMQPGYSGNVRQRIEEWETATEGGRSICDSLPQALAQGINMTGVSGVGKSTAIRRILSL